MSDIKLSKNQSLAVNTRNKNILVSAAAGSGKTFVLVQRILKLITEDGIDIDSLLVVTFTKAAANEMRERIGNAINKALSSNPYDKNLQRQLLLLNKASISTIDAFCGNIVRNNFYKVNIDPGYRIVTEASEIKKMQQSAIDRLFNLKYEKNDENFINLINSYCRNYKDDTLSKFIIDIYNKASDNPYPIKWLEMCRDNYDIDKFGSFYNTPFGKEYTKIIGGYYNKICKLNKKILSLNASIQYTPAYNEIHNFITKFSQYFKYDDIDDTEDFYIPNNISAYDLIDTVSLYMNKVNALYINSDIIDKVLANQKPLVDTLIDLIIEFSKIYKDIKTEKKVAEFNDILHYAHDLLIDENGNITSVAESLRDKYNEIIIDEYQDSNNLQESILTSFSRGNNMFMVGDIKQSIYKFRQSNPELFKQKYYEYPNDDNSVLIQLSDNYRSKSCVIDFCNYIFRQIMTSDFGDVDYTKDVELKSKDKNPEIYNKTEIHVLEKIKNLPDDLAGFTNTEYEADYIALQVENLLNSDKNIKPEDIAILSRNKKSKFYALLNALSKRGINAIAENNSSFNATLEVQTIMSLLKIINNPCDNIPLITVLHSHIYNFTNDELIKIKKSHSSRLLYNCINNYVKSFDDDISDKLQKFIDDISRFREFARNNTLSRLISFLYDQTCYYTYVNLLPNGKQRQANLTLLNELSESFETYNPNNLKAFIDYIENAEDLNEANVFDSSKSAVQIVTMHSAKGLEYPIVIIGFTGDKIKKNKYYPIIHQKYGFALKLIENEYYALDTPLGDLFKQLLIDEELSEALRLLYVALTRAKEKLIITGISPYKIFDAYKDINNNPQPLCYGDDHYLSWIMYCVCNKFDGVDITYVPWDNCLLNSHFYSNEILSFASKIESINTKCQYSSQTESIYNELNYKYHNLKAQQLPTKISISEIKRLHSHNTDTESELLFNKTTFEYPDFLTPKKSKLNAAQKGTIYHCVFEHLDFYSTNTKKDIESALNNMLEQNILKQNEIEVISIDKIYSFVKSNLYKRIQKSPKFFKETQFIMNMKGNEIYGDEYADVDADITVRGIIDLYFIENDYIILVDYKTDYIKNHNIEILKDKYDIQLKLYKKALEKNTKMPVKECIIYSVSEDKELII